MSSLFTKFITRLPARFTSYLATVPYKLTVFIAKPLPIRIVIAMVSTALAFAVAFVYLIALCSIRPALIESTSKKLPFEYYRPSKQGVYECVEMDVCR